MSKSILEIANEEQERRKRKRRMHDRQRQRFIDRYVAAFLATHTAINLDNACMMGKQAELSNNQPVEDAVFLARKAWQSLQEVSGIMRDEEAPGHPMDGSPRPVVIRPPRDIRNT